MVWVMCPRIGLWRVPSCASRGDGPKDRVLQGVQYVGAWGPRIGHCRVSNLASSASIGLMTSAF